MTMFLENNNLFENGCSFLRLGLQCNALASNLLTERSPEILCGHILCNKCNSYSSIYNWCSGQDGWAHPICTANRTKPMCCLCCPALMATVCRAALNVAVTLTTLLTSPSSHRITGSGYHATKDVSSYHLSWKNQVSLCNRWNTEPFLLAFQVALLTPTSFKMYHGRFHHSVSYENTAFPAARMADWSGKSELETR